MVKIEKENFLVEIDSIINPVLFGELFLEYIFVKKYPADRGGVDTLVLKEEFGPRTYDCDAAELEYAFEKMYGIAPGPYQKDIFDQMEYYVSFGNPEPIFVAISWNVTTQIFIKYGKKEVVSRALETGEWVWVHSNLEPEASWETPGYEVKPRKLS